MRTREAKTEKIRNYTWGFNLTEDDLCKIVNLVQKSLSRLSVSIEKSPSIRLTLKDDTVTFPSDVDEIFTLENSGNKSVIEVHLDWFLNAENKEVVVSIFLKMDSRTEKVGFLSDI